MAADFAVWFVVSEAHYQQQKYTLEMINFILQVNEKGVEKRFMGGRGGNKLNQQTFYF